MNKKLIEPSFAFEIKLEIANKKMSKNDCNSFIDGMLFSLYISNKRAINVSIKNKKLLSLFEPILKKSGKEFIQLLEKKEFNSLIIQQPNAKNATYFLAGAFFASGSISRLSSSSYHLQISVKNADHANKLVEFCKKHITFNIAINKKQFVLYIKKHELISDFLYIIGAQNSYFKFIESVIERDHRNQITRISNLDIHNQSKLVDSNKIFLNNLEFIKKNKLDNHFTEEQMIFYNFKKQNPYLPLSQLVDELARKHKIIKTKGGLNHWLIKLRNVCDEFKKINS